MNLICSEFDIMEPYPYYKMSSVDNADLQDREVWMGSGMYDETFFEYHHHLRSLQSLQYWVPFVIVR